MQLDFLSSIKIENVCATLLSGTTVCGVSCVSGTKVIENGTCLASTYLGINATADNALALCGCTPNCFTSKSIGLSGATNGLSTTSNKVKLGGILTECTHIEGGYCFDINAIQGFNVRTSGNTDINIDAQNCGGFILKSQCGNVNTFPDFTNAIGFYGNIDQPNGFAIYDCRTGSAQAGIVYNADYSANYVARSIPDKAYVDSVATGLNVHAAVIVATTGPITLSGSPQTIDGIPTTTGMRVLVKNQSLGATNGIYSASTSTWSRTSDYDGTPIGEVVNGDLIPVTSGSSQNSSIWVLTTLNPITVGTTSLNFSEFSTILDITAGNGINVVQTGGVHNISVQLATNCGLTFCGTGLAVNPNIAGTDLTYTNGVLAVCASCFLGVTACAADSAKLNNQSASYYASIDSPNFTTCIKAPIACVNSCVRSPIISGSTCVTAPIVCGACILGTTCVCSPVIIGSTCLCGGVLCGSCAILSCFVGIGGCSTPSYYASGVSASGPVNASFLKANFYGLNQTSIHLNWDAADNYGIGSKSGNIVNLEGACNIGGGRTFNGTAVDFRVTGCVSGSTKISSPIICGGTCVCGAIVCSTNCVMAGGCVCGQTIYAGLYVCATTSVLSGTFMCATSYLQAAACAIIGTCATIGTNILMTTGAARCIDWNAASTGVGSALLINGNTGLSCTGSNACAGGSVCIRGGCGGAAISSGIGGAGGTLWLCGGVGGAGTPTGTGGAICMVVDTCSAIVALPSSCVTLYYCGNSRLCTVTNGICIGSNCGFGTDWVATSDCRLKTDIQPISNALSIVTQLQGICYHACDDCSCENRIGLIAQDVLKIIPEIVSHSQPNEEDMKYGITDEKLGLKYDKLTAVLVEAIKEQQKQIKEQEKQLHCLCCELNYWRNSKFE